MARNIGAAGTEFALPSALAALQSELAETRLRLAEAERIVAALPKNDRFYRAMFEQSVVGMARVSAATGRFEQVNSALCDLVGYSMEEMAQFAPGDITFADERAADAAAIAAMRRGETDTYDLQKRYVHKDGRLIWVHARATLVRDAQGNPEGTFSIIEDITGRKATEAALRESEEFNRTVLEASPDCLKVIDAAGRIEYINENGACLLEIDDCATVLGQNWEMLWPASEHDTVRNGIAAGLAGNSVKFTVAAPTAKGTPKVWEVAIAPVPVADGKPTKLIAASRDVTELRRGEALLRESEARFRGTFENAAMGVALVALDGTWLAVNARLCEITGYPREELLTKTFQDITHPDDVDADVHQARMVELGELESYQMDKRYIRKDGSIVWIGLTVSLQQREDGEPDYFISIVRDISERKNAVDALRENETRLQQALSAARAGLWASMPGQGAFVASDRALTLYGLSPETEMTHELALAAVHPDDRQQVVAALRETVEHGVPFRMEMRIPQPGGASRWLLSQAEQRETGWIVGLVQDITEQKEREDQIQLLLSEVNHRSKNLLGVVLSVARQTAGGNHEEYMQRFAERIQSLAAGQDLLVKSQWKGVPLDDLVTAQLGHFKDLIGDRIVLAGPAVLLSATTAQTIGMALHELATNASKYGALSTDQGRVDIAWQSVAGSGSARRFVMTWTESGGPPVRAPQRRGFGSTVTGKIVRMSLDCDVTANFAPAGFSWRLDCPWENVIDQQPFAGITHTEAANELAHSGD